MKLHLFFVVAVQLVLQPWHKAKLLSNEWLLWASIGTVSCWRKGAIAALLLVLRDGLHWFDTWCLTWLSPTPVGAVHTRLHSYKQYGHMCRHSKVLASGKHIFFILNYLIPWNWGWLCQFMQISLTHCTQNAVLYNQKVHSQMDMHHYWQLDFRVWKHVPQAIVFVFRLGLLVWLENSLRHCLTYDGACKTPTFCKLFCGNIQGDGWKFLGHWKHHFWSQITSQSSEKVHIYRLKPKSATKGEYCEL